LLARGVTPVLCGGTGLYLRAALDDFCFDEGRDDEGLREGAAGEGAAAEGAAAEGAADKRDAGERGACDEGLASDGGGDGRDGVASERRARLQAQAEELGADAFHALFAARDPESAELIHPHNIRRVIRAFEIFEQGGSYARQREGFGRFEPVYPARLIGLAVEPEVLYEVIERRVDSMIAYGLLEEVQRLLDEGFREAICARQAIGYKELVPVLAGECALEEAVARVKQATRRYAKRQRTWFKRDERIEWLDVTDLHRARLAGRLDAHAFAQALLARTLPIL
jgi:tRNA A37 N6-isopentenylltransferase MiaA